MEGAREMSESDRERLVEALGTIAELMGRDGLDSIRNTVEELERRLTGEIAEAGRRLDSVVPEIKEEMTRETEKVMVSVAAVDERLAVGIERAGQAAQAEVERVRSDLESRLDDREKQSAESDESRRRQIEEMGDRLSGVSSDFEDRLDRARTDLEGRVAQLESELAEKASNRIEAVETAVSEARDAHQSIDEKVDGLAQAFRDLEQKFTDQTTTSSRLSGLLTNLETVFSAQRAAQQGAAAVTTAGDASVAGAEADRKKKGDGEAPQMSSNELDNALNNLFQGS